MSLNLPRAAPGVIPAETPPLKTAFPDSVSNIPTGKTGDAACGRTAASSHHAATNLLTGRKVSNLAIKMLKTDLIKYPSPPPYPMPSLFKLHFFHPDFMLKICPFLRQKAWI